MKKLFILLVTIVATVISVDTYAQNVTVTGQVTYKTLEGNEYPAIGAYVIIKGTSFGTTTDLDGCFALSIKNFKPGTIIQISLMIGFEIKEIVLEHYNREIKLGKITLMEDSLLMGNYISKNNQTDIPTYNLSMPNRP